MGCVSAGHPLAVEAGLGALEQGGNAIDAVVAGAFAAFVAEPNNAGIGVKKSNDEVIWRLLGVHPGYGQLVGLDDGWAARVIEAVGE